MVMMMVVAGHFVFPFVSTHDRRARADRPAISSGCDKLRKLKICLASWRLSADTGTIAAQKQGDSSTNI
jgi:hypothetical protein